MQASNAQPSGNFAANETDISNYRNGTESGTSPEPVRNNYADETARKESRITSSGEGYSDFFADTSGPVNKAVSIGTGSEPEQTGTVLSSELGLSIKEAIEFYKISEKTIRLRIKEGKIPARKVQGANVLEWRIYPNGFPPKADSITNDELFVDDAEPNARLVEIDSDFTEAETDPVPERYQSGSNPAVQAPMVVSIAPELATLMDVITKQAEKLEAANLRIGYLQAQTDNYQREIKLLTDSQHKISWWSRFGAWLVGKK